MVGGEGLLGDVGWVVVGSCERGWTNGGRVDDDLMVGWGLLYAMNRLYVQRLTFHSV